MWEAFGMDVRERSGIVVTTLAAVVAISVIYQPLLHDLLHREWRTPSQPHCLWLGLLYGILAGMAVGFLLFTCIRHRRTLGRFVLALCAAMAISGLVGALAALLGVGNAWPSEIEYGVDGDILLSYGFAAGMLGSAVSSGLFAALAPVKDAQ
jgi:hypothetical protein